MKKVTIIIFCLSMFIVFGVFNLPAKQVSAAVNANRFFVYVTNLYEIRNIPSDAQILDLGFAYEVSSSSPIQTKNTNRMLGGSSRYKVSSEKVNMLLDDLGVVVKNRQQLNDLVVLDGFVKVGFNQTERVQVSIRGDIVTVGSPVIFGSY